MVSTGDILAELARHLELTAIALALAALIGIPLGVILSRERWLSGPVLAIVSAVYTIPSVALLGFMIPLFGIGPRPAIVAIFVYALLPIVRNTFTGIRQIDPAAVEAARGMGMTDTQILRRVTIPLALPFLLAGVRTSTVLSVAVATLAALVGARGLGTFVFQGIDMTNTRMILSGAVPIAALALALDWLLSLVERWVAPASDREP
jgi:osmoprotectant transport system permease protein